MNKEIQKKVDNKIITDNSIKDKIINPEKNESYGLFMKSTGRNYKLTIKKEKILDNNIFKNEKKNLNENIIINQEININNNNIVFENNDEKNITEENILKNQNKDMENCDITLKEKENNY